MGKMIFEEMKKIFMRPVIRVTALLVLLVSVYLISFVSGGIIYYYDTESGETTKITSPSGMISLKREYARRLKGVMTEHDVEQYYKEYQALVSDAGNYSRDRDLRAERDRRYELLGEGFSADEIDRLDETEPIYGLKPRIQYHELWKYQPVSHLFPLCSDEQDQEFGILKKLLSEGALFDWCGGYVHAITLADNVLSIFIGILIILGSSTVFSEESQYKLKRVVSATKYGESRLVCGKILGSFLYTTIVVLTMLGLDLIISEAAYGLGNGNVYIQMSEKFMGYETLVTHGRMFWTAWFCILAGALCFNALVLLVSSVCDSDFAAVFTSFILYMVFNMWTLLLDAEEHSWKLLLPTTLMRPLEYFEKSQPLFLFIFSGMILMLFVLLLSIRMYQHNLVQYVRVHQLKFRRIRNCS